MWQQNLAVKIECLTQPLSLSMLTGSRSHNLLCDIWYNLLNAQLIQWCLKVWLRTSIKNFTEVNVSCYKAYFWYCFTESKYCTIFDTECSSYKHAAWRKLSDTVVISRIIEKCIFFYFSKVMIRDLCKILLLFS